MTKDRPFVSAYFAGAFSGNGFTNYLPDAIKDMQKIYIIKGTPGSGKSTLMKKISASAEECGMATEKIYCSSDPNSLDGVVIPAISFAMIDGTAPHVMDATYPVAVETIINTADFLSHVKVEEHREEIISLSNRKKRLFSHAETLLKAELSLRKLKNELLEDSYNANKGFKFCRNIILKERKFKKEGTVTQRSCYAFYRSGVSRLPSFDDAKKIYSVNEDFAPFILGTLRLLALEYKIPAICSPDPFESSQTASIYFPLSGKLFQNAEFGGKKGEKISSERFSNREVSQKRKEKIKFLSKTENLILSEAKEYLTMAMEHHKELEKLYISAMNKEGLDCLANSIIISLFENQK